VKDDSRFCGRIVGYTEVGPPLRRRATSGLADYQALASRFHRRLRNFTERVDFENPLDPG
jgi:hypothetical protein